MLAYCSVLHASLSEYQPFMLFLLSVYLPVLLFTSPVQEFSPKRWVRKGGFQLQLIQTQMPFLSDTEYRELRYWIWAWFFPVMRGRDCQLACSFIYPTIWQRDSWFTARFCVCRLASWSSFGQADCISIWLHVRVTNSPRNWSRFEEILFFSFLKEVMGSDGHDYNTRKFGWLNLISKLSKKQKKKNS